MHILSANSQSSQHPFPTPESQGTFHYRCCTELELSPLSRNRSVTAVAGVYQPEWKNFACRQKNGFDSMPCIGSNVTRSRWCRRPGSWSFRCGSPGGSGGQRHCRFLCSRWIGRPGAASCKSGLNRGQGCVKNRNGGHLRPCKTVNHDLQIRHLYSDQIDG